MSPETVVFSLLLVLALAALAWWVFSRPQRPREEAEARQHLSAERFDTTMGELRDLREALRPAERAAAKKGRPERATADAHRT